MDKTSTEIISDRPCSCEFSVNAKGDVSFKVKAYCDTLSEAIDEAFKGMNEVEKKLKEKAGSQKSEPAVA